MLPPLLLCSIIPCIYITHTHTHIYIHTAYTYTYIYTAYMHIHIYIYTHTQTHTHILFGASLVSQKVKNPPAMWETQVLSLQGEDPPEKGMATHSCILAWKIHGQRSLAGYSPWSHRESDMIERLSMHTYTHTYIYIYIYIYIYKYKHTQRHRFIYRYILKS